jgi:ankyrin repeat protein
VGIKDSHGRTPLHFAARSGSSALLKLLQSLGGDMKALDEGGRSPLLYAVRKYALGAVNWLVSAGAPISGPPDSHGLTPLHHAVLAQAPAVVQCLLEAGANPLAADVLGNNPYQLAAQLASPGNGEANERQWEVLQLLSATLTPAQRLSPPQGPKKRPGE